MLGHIGGNSQSVLSGESGRGGLVIHNPGGGICRSCKIAYLHILTEIILTLIVCNLGNDNLRLGFSLEYHRLLDLRQTLEEVVCGIFEADYHLGTDRESGLSKVITLQDDSSSGFSRIVHKRNDLI